MHSKPSKQQEKKYLERKENTEKLFDSLKSNSQEINKVEPTLKNEVKEVELILTDELREELLNKIRSNMNKDLSIYHIIRQCFSSDEIEKFEKYFGSLNNAIRRSGFDEYVYKKKSEGLIQVDGQWVKFEFRLTCEDCGRSWEKDRKKCFKCDKPLKKIKISNNDLQSYKEDHNDLLIREQKWNEKFNNMSFEDEYKYFIDKEQEQKDYLEFHKNELRRLSYLGFKKYKKLIKAGINTLKELISVDSEELFRKSGLPIRTIEKLKRNTEAIIDNKIIQVRPFNLPSDVIYFDIETDLWQSYIWMVGAYYQGKFYPFYSNSRKKDKDILQDFLNFINNHPDSMLCYYSPKGFDRRLLINSFNEYGLKVQDFTKRKFLDLAVEIKSRFHLPTTYGLKDVSKSLNYNFKYPDMDGFAAAHLYEEDSIKNKSKLINYNKDDLLSMKHIIDVLNKGDIENIKKEFEEIAFPEDISGPIDEDRIVELKNKGYKLQEIADMTGRSVTYIYGRINKKYAPAYLKEEYAEEDKENSFKFKNSRGEKNQKSDMLPIGISWLNSLGFCEQWVYLKYCKKLDFEITERMKEGSKIHEEKEIEFLKHAVPTTWKDFIASEKLVSSREKTVGMILKDVILIGKIDKIEVDKNGVYVIDDKPKPKLYPGIKNQLLTYSVVLKHYLKDALNKSLYAVLKDRDTEEDVWKKKIEDSDEKIVIKTVMRMRGILKDEISPVPTKNINKCRNCVYKHNCEFSIIQTLPSKPI